MRLHASGYTTGRNHVGFYLPVFARKGDKERKKQMVWLAFLFKFQTCTLEFPYFCCSHSELFDLKVGPNKWVLLLRSGWVRLSLGWVILGT